MANISLVLLGAGSSSRFRTSSSKVYPKKQWLYSGDNPLWLQVAKSFEEIYKFDNIVIVSSSDDIEFMKVFDLYKFVRRYLFQMVYRRWFVENIRKWPHRYW